MPEGIQISPQPSEVGSVSVGNVVRKFIGKTVAPTVNDDITSGYIVSDIWIDETGNNVYVCVDNTDGAAVWNLALGPNDVDDTPVDGATTVPVSSNWAFDTDTKLTPLIDDSMADTLHRHSELSASDGIPDRALVVDALGNVGIGTTGPTALLNLKGILSSALTGTVAVTNLSTAVVSTSTLFTTELAVGDSIKIGTEVFTVSVITDALNLTLDSAYQGATASGLTAYRDPTLFAIDNGDAVNKLIITRSGNVGIGTTGPVGKLDVSGSITTRSAAPGGTGASAGVFDFSNGYNRFFSYGANVSTKGAFTFLQKSSDESLGNTPIEVLTGGNVLLAQTGGNVGIGTTTPQAKLDVAGTLSQAYGNDTQTMLLHTKDFISDTVISGCLPATSANLTSDISAGIAYSQGRRIIKVVTSKTYTASKDTYLDLKGVGTYTFVEVALGAAAPAITADSIRLAKVVTDATAITSVTDLRTLSLAITVNGLTRFIVNASGNVGIGTTGPTHKLVVYDNTLIIDSVTQAQLYIKNAYSTASGHISIGLDKGNSGATAAFGFLSVGVSQWDAGIIDSNKFIIRDTANNQKIFTLEQGAGVNALYIKNNGNVGIRTATPSGTMHVVRGAEGGFNAIGDEVIIAQRNDATNDNAIISLTSGTSGISQLRLGDADLSYAGAISFFNTDNSLRFQIANSPKLTVASTGNVGIGTTTPTAALHLKAGTATAGRAPFKFTVSGAVVLTTPEVGVIEPNAADDIFYTITTGVARKGIVLNDGANLTSGKIPIASTNGRLIDGPTPLAGTKVYYVSDTSGGVTNRKLTFVDGILTAET